MITSVSMFCTERFGLGVDATAASARIAGTFAAPMAYNPPAPHAGWAGAAIAPQRKRRTAATTDASVNRGLF